MLVAESRPRNLGWTHAGPLLFGDWGTSRLYVLGLAFYYTGHASPFYLTVMSLIMAVVAWGYTIVCRCFPDGGGVYSAARRLSPTLSVIAATLLICDFIITAALSAIEGFHYFGAEGNWVVVFAAIGTMIVLGAVNWFGAKSAGRFALVIAIAAICASAIIGALCIPLLPAGIKTATMHVDGVTTNWNKWESLVRIVLALSGVEAVASMTGLMKTPVEKTAKKTIWPVLIEVVLLNLIFGIALNALPGRVETKTPDYVKYEVRANFDSSLKPAANATTNTPTGSMTPAEVAHVETLKQEAKDVLEYRQTAVKVLAEHAGTTALGAATGRALGIASGIVFGLLLLSAANTAILAMVSVFYALGQDKEVPSLFTKLNYSGVPWVGLLISAAAPCLVLLFVHDDKALGELYAIGVVGAIAINMVCCAWNKDLPIKKWERIGLWAIGILMSGIFLTIVVAKPHATIFAGSICVAVLIVRTFVRKRAAERANLPEPVQGWLAELQQNAATKLPPGKPRIMLAARGRQNAEFAVDLARKKDAILFGIYIRTLRVMDVTPGALPKIESDPQAQETLGQVSTIARRAGVPFYPIYLTATDVADEVLDYTVTFGCETLIMGKSNRGTLSRALEGDVVAKVAQHLPEGVSLITRAADIAATVTPLAEKPTPAPHTTTDDGENHGSGGKA